MSELEPPQFALFAYSGAVLWVGTFLSLGYFLGERWHYVQNYADRYMLLASIAAAIVAGAYVAWRYWWRKRRPAP